MFRAGPRPSRSEALLFSISLGLVPAALLAAEGSLALLDHRSGPDAPSVSIDRLHRYSEIYGWEPRPGSYFDDGHRISINDAGYRGRPLPAPRDPAKTRVVLVGDSIAFGLYVDDGETYAARLEARRPDLEVANLAVQGYSPGQALMRLEHLGLGLDPDVVVMAVCLGNDFADAGQPTFLYDDSHRKPYHREEGGRLVRHDAHLKLDVRERLSLWLAEHSRLFRALQPDVSKADDGPWTRRRGEAMRDRPAAVSLVARLIVEARDLSRAHGARFVALLHPDRVAGAKASATWEAALAARLDAAGVEHVRLSRVYARRGLDYDSVASDTIGHLTPVGHDVTADILDARLRRPAAAPVAELTGKPPLPPR